jgi:hypothetical protein
LKEDEVAGGGSWASAVDGYTNGAAAASRPNSCSPVGSYGFTGCAAAALRQWFEARRAPLTRAVAGIYPPAGYDTPHKSMIPAADQRLASACRWMMVGTTLHGNDGARPEGGYRRLATRRRYLPLPDIG